MGQCGCGNFNGIARIKAPNKTWYVIQIYPGCRYCDTSAGVLLHQMTSKELKEDWDCEDLPVLEVSPYGLNIPVLHYNEVAKQTVESLQDWVDDVDDYSFRDAVHKISQEWIENIKQRMNDEI